MTELEIDNDSILSLLDPDSSPTKILKRQQRYIKKLEEKNNAHRKKWKNLNDQIFPISFISIFILPVLWLVCHSNPSPLFSVLSIVTGTLFFLSFFLTLVTSLNIITFFVNDSHRLEKKGLNKKSSKLFKAHYKATQEYNSTIRPYWQQLQEEPIQLAVFLKLEEMRKTVPIHRREWFDSFVDNFEGCIQEEFYEIGFAYIPMIMERLQEWKSEPIPQYEEVESQMSYIDLLKNKHGYMVPRQNIAKLL